MKHLIKIKDCESDFLQRLIEDNDSKYQIAEWWIKLAIKEKIDRGHRIGISKK